MRQRSALTLIELLVVLLITLALLGMLLPATASVRRAADQQRCLGGQRQLHQAMTVYAVEHDGLLVASSLAGAGFWGPALAEIVHGERTVAGWGWGTIAARNILWSCPTWRGRDTGGGIIAVTSPGLAMNKSVQAPVAGDNDPAPAPLGGGRSYRLNAIQRSAQRAAFLDGNDWNLGTWNAPSATANAPTERVLPVWLASGPRRHGPALNMVFFDGHGARVPLTAARFAIADPSRFQP